ncbi:hypothetical protein [Flavimarina sp. Hel_I_48]|uniref:hypothetical protein n=1 Tax=Flavimarina sp. Hel_I_48 TaxID=1392488 RepID=UPI0013DD2936|nr:hypothetical protein [Flavimarina sp. Hel_I_48]
MTISNIVWIIIALILVALIIKENREMAMIKAELDLQQDSEDNSIDDIQKKPQI